MWITDLQQALEKLFKIYDFHCCIEKIQDNLIYMTDFTVWRFSEHELEKVGKWA